MIHIHLGQFGIQSGIKVWELYCKEHGIKKDGTISENVPIENMYRFNCFTESAKGSNENFLLFFDRDYSKEAIGLSFLWKIKL